MCGPRTAHGLAVVPSRPAPCSPVPGAGLIPAEPESPLPIGGDGLFAPRALRGDTDLGRLLLALEVPDCDCPLPDVRIGLKLRLALERYAAERGLDEVMGYLRLVLVVVRAQPCRCTAVRGHGLSVDEWVELLAEYDPAGYLEPPLDNEPSLAITRAGRVEMMTGRAEAGLAIEHPGDINPAEVDHLWIESLTGKFQGELKGGTGDCDIGARGEV